MPQLRIIATEVGLYKFLKVISLLVRVISIVKTSVQLQWCNSFGLFSRIIMCENYSLKWCEQSKSACDSILMNIEILVSIVKYFSAIFSEDKNFIKIK